MWTDVNINIPTKEIKNCCKRQSAKISLEDLKTYGKNIFTKHELLENDKRFMIQENKLPDACYGCKITWPNSLWSVWNLWKEKEWSKDELYRLIDEDKVYQIEIMLGITCNQACMYCTEYVSSKWADIKRIDIKPDDEWENLALTNLYNYIENDRYNDSNSILYNFLGGEPFLEPKIFEVIENLIKIHKDKNVQYKRININMTTNLNIKPKTIDRYLEMVSGNREISWSLSASIDSLGKQGEEIRDGLIFSRFEHNLEKIYESNMFTTISLLPSVSALSIPNKIDLIKWFFNLSFRYKKPNEFGHSFNIASNIVTWPDAMHPGILTDEYKSEIDKCINYIDNLDSTSNTQKYKNHLINLRNIIGTKRQTSYLESSRKWYQDQGRLKGKDYFEIFPFLNVIL
jgi:organic radical activating enzyme